MSRENYATEAMSEGSEAARNGQGECPHPLGTFERRSWILGHNLEQQRFLKRFHAELAKAQGSSPGEKPA